MSSSAKRTLDRDEYDQPEPRGIGGFLRDVGVRETIESILVAVMLALLFKAFEAEAFVIPTGSMAPTLMGQHKDITCSECGFPYRCNASSESEERGRQLVVETTCPLCRYTREIDPETDRNDATFSGDRILVSKFAYDIAPPQRWDVIVFRYPRNAKQNYIKRLTGLPGEWLLIENGDLHTWQYPQDDPEAIPPNREAYQIARKPPRKLLAMLQIVDDNHYIAESLQEVGWPLRWQDWSAGETSSWNAELEGRKVRYSISAQPETAWLSYRHLVPQRHEWREIKNGHLPERIATDPAGELITDFYAYNQQAYSRLDYNRPPNDAILQQRGTNWVGDLALEAEVDVQSDSGQLLFQLVEGGVRFTCTIDVATGKASLAADSNDVQFDGSETAEGPTAETRLRGSGSYRVRFANADDELYLWINDRPIEFTGPTTFLRQGPVLPQWSPSDPGDAQPAAVGASNLSATVNHLRVLRDIYYISDRKEQDSTLVRKEYHQWPGSVRRNQQILDTPALWNTPDGQAMFLRRSRDRTEVAFLLQDDQFFAMGDNSPASSDARFWTDHNYVERENLVGKALFLYWPHTWWRPIPFFPNFKRIGFIR